jgi:WD40 repeat protein
MKQTKIFTLIIFLIPLYLFSQNNEIVFPIKHFATLTSLKYSDNKLYIATSSNDWTIKLWLASNGTLIRTFNGHTGAVNCLDFSKNGKYIVSGSNDSTVIIWDLLTGTRNKEIINLGGKVLSIAFNINNENIVAGTNNGKVVIINVTNGMVESTYSFASTKITHIGFTKEKNKLLVSTSVISESNETENNSTGSIFLFDYFSFNKPIAISNYKENVNNFCFSPDSEKVVSSASNGMVRVWKIKNYIEEIAFKNSNLSPGIVFISGNGKIE